jgi:hypothetical protein
MNRRQVIDGLKLSYHRFGNNQVYAIPTVRCTSMAAPMIASVISWMVILGL